MTETTLAVEIALTFGLLRNGTDGPRIPYGDALDWLARSLEDRGQAFYSVTDGTGFYQGAEESNLRLSIIADAGTIQLDHLREAMTGLAREFAREFDQDSVMYTEQDTRWNFIS